MLKKLALLAVLAALPAALARPRAHNSEMVSYHARELACIVLHLTIEVSIYIVCVLRRYLKIVHPGVRFGNRLHV